jgi:hypothetical protein
MGFDGNNRRRMTPEEEATLKEVSQSFFAFLPFWRFKNRETGAILSMAELWQGQQRFAELMITEPRILALKAGKLGFTELESAYDAWVALFSQPNARVHLFSLNADSARDLLRYVHFGITHLPWYMRLPIVSSSEDTLRLRAGPDDVRTIVSYAASPHAAIDQSATHSHVDELARMLHGEATWQSVQSTIAPGGTCHIVTRGAGDANFVANLWEQATDGTAYLKPFFAAYTERPGRDAAWREREAASMNLQGLLFFAPETPEDALAGDDTAEFVNAASWDRCHDPDLPELDHRTPIVLGIDAAVVGDTFAIVAVSRHPKDSHRPAIRAVKIWNPKESAGGRVDFIEVEDWIEAICTGRCANGHTGASPDSTCDLCRMRLWTGDYNVVQIVYDPYQMEATAQRIRRKNYAWVNPCDQSSERLIADSDFHKYIITGLLAHTGHETLREHVMNVRAKLQKDEDSKLRMVKKAANRKIDAAVAGAMAIKRIMYLNV